MNWPELAARLIVAVPKLVKIAGKIKGSGRGKEKFQVVVDSLPEEIGIVEYVANKDLLNDPAILQLRDAAIDAEAAALKAREAFHAGLLAKAPAA